MSARSSPSPPFLTQADLPEKIALFPLSEVLLLPGGRLPLQVFEPRYLAMVRDQLGTELRLIGMIQKAGSEPEEWPPLMPVGSAGRIISFIEQEQERYFILLDGCCRFRLIEELDSGTAYRSARVAWDEFGGDLDPHREDSVAKLDRKTLEPILRAYLSRHGLGANWKAVAQMSDYELVTSLAMLCPFSSTEKQILLEANDPDDMVRTLTALLEIGLHEVPGTNTIKH